MTKGQIEGLAELIVTHRDLWAILKGEESAKRIFDIDVEGKELMNDGLEMVGQHKNRGITEKT